MIGRKPASSPGRRLGRITTVIRFALALAVLAPAAGICTAETGTASSSLQADAQAAADPSLQINSRLRVRVTRGREIELDVQRDPGEDLATLAARLSGDARGAAAIEAWNASPATRNDPWIRVPLALLSGDYRRLVLTSLFPDDRREGQDWIHYAQTGAVATYDEGLWQVAAWFTGRGERFAELMEANGLSSPELRAQQPVRIPATLLLPAFLPTLMSEDGTLEYGSDARGPFAAYTLAAGEAVYTAVVVRFTGRTAAEDVNELSELLRVRNSIADMRDIPVGFRVKIPLDLLEPQYLPPGHPRRQRAEEARAALDRELARQPVGGPGSGLEGVVVVLDAGHGGRDLGTMHNGVWEHDYVYDVVCRIKERLERETAARVVLTLQDTETGCVPSTGDRLEANRQGTIQTNPPFLAVKEGDARVGVNLRWYLANSIYRAALAEGTEPDRVVFLSIHADSRHRSLRGAMVYVPGAGYRARTYGFTSAPYSRFAEVKEKPRVRFSSQERIRSEAVSRRLAQAIVRSYRELDLPVQQHQPVRNRIIRGKSKYVPAVIRGNAIPTKVLIEMINMSNPEDARILATAADRSRLADGVLGALFLHFGEDSRRIASRGTGTSGTGRASP